MPAGSVGMPGTTGNMPAAAPPPGGMPRPPAGGADDQRAAMMAKMMQALPAQVQKDIQKELGGKKIQDLPPEQRNKIMAKVRDAMKAAGVGPGGPGPAPGGITEKDRENAKLPLSPEEDSQLSVLLRPGLLADVEIIVDKIPDAISIPNQALLEKDGRQFVFVQNLKDNRFEERTIKLAKRSESVMVIAEGLKPGEIVALGDPTAKKKDKNEKSSGSSKTIMPAQGVKGN